MLYMGGGSPGVKDLLGGLFARRVIGHSSKGDLPGEDGNLRTIFRPKTAGAKGCQAQMKVKGGEDRVEIAISRRADDDALRKVRDLEREMVRDVLQGRSVRALGDS